VIGDGDGLGLLDLVTGQKILELRCVDSRQDLSAPHGIIYLRQLLADLNKEDRGDGGG
jgi:hypothetical protein